MKYKKTALISCLCFALGLTLSLQLRSASIGRKMVSDAEKAEKEYLLSLQNEIDNQKAINEGLNKKIVQYTEDIEEYKQKANDVDGYTELITGQLDRAMLAAGLTEVTGPGIEVRVTDNDSELTASVDGMNLHVVHQEDLLKIVNELCDADAEAVSINGERLIANSEIRCAGSTVSVNNRRYSAPFIIRAIGNPENLAGALNMRDGVVDSLSKWLNIEISKKDSIVIPAYVGTIEYKYAKTVRKEDAE